MDCVRNADGRDRSLGQAQVTNLTCYDQAAHCAHRILDGHVRVHPVLVVEVDHVHAKPLEAGVAGGPHVVRLAADAGSLAVRTPGVAELGGNEHLLAHASQRLTRNASGMMV